jgi:RIO kinase 1
MNNTDLYDLYTDYDDYENGRSAHRSRDRWTKKPKQNKRANKKQEEVLAMDDGITTWVPTYAQNLDPLHHERQWVINAVAHFYQENIITDVTRRVKGGKEANVYACVAHPASGVDWIAAKLYRERMLRSLKNDAVYKVGRTIRDREGKQVRNSRERRAIINKSGYGQEVDFMMWVGTEYRTQTLLYEAGADVPKPVAQHGHSILMEFIGDEYGAAPALNETSLARDEAAPLFQRVLKNVEIMLDHHLIHGDLSAYNILYWDGDIWLIDFPQAVEARVNPHAYEILERDITRVSEYFARFGVDSNPKQLAWDLWYPYSQREGIE